MSQTKNTASVVLVDDNPYILALLREGIEPLADTRAFREPAGALRHCIQDPPDLVICDYRMPELDGSELVRKLKERPQTKGVRVMMLAAKADVDEKLLSLSEMVEDFVVKPFFLKDLASRTKKVLDRIYLEKMQQQAPQEGVMRGRLSEMNIIDLLQSLELGQKTCLLTITRDTESCLMFFSAGQINHAELGSISGDQAVYRVATWPEGSFQIDFNGRSDKHTTTQTTQGLLMEALRLLDEQKRDSGE